MYELKKMEKYLRVNLLGPGPRLMKKEFSGPRSHKSWETLLYMFRTNICLSSKSYFCTRSTQYSAIHLWGV